MQRMGEVPAGGPDAGAGAITTAKGKGGGKGAVKGKPKAEPKPKVIKEKSPNQIARAVTRLNYPKF